MGYEHRNRRTKPEGLKMNTETRERLGLLLDMTENYLAATELQMPAHIHVEGLKCGMADIAKELREILKQQP